MNPGKSPPAGAPLRAATTIAAPFTQAWIQALTLAAGNPLARTIKPQLEWINVLSRSRAEADRAQAAEELWQVAQREGLSDLLQVLPVYRAQWDFPSDEKFIYRRRDADTLHAVAPGDSSEPSSSEVARRSAVGNPAASANGDFAAWCSAMGLRPLEVSLIAEVFSGDWASLVRSEAVRLQQSLSLSAVAQATTLQLPCTARWDSQGWSITFDQVDWVVITYDELPVMQRPTYAGLEELLSWLLAMANDTMLVKRAANCNFTPTPTAWENCVASLQPLHAGLRQRPSSYAPWLLRTWHCVWPTVYREQQVLRERADIDVLRRELKACLDAQPRLCMWMFLFAKLICQTQLTTGLGFCADFGD
ncbi:MAG: hypothetical protein KDA72_04020 [Planctomycetales bacterium]|nr:hypothetical protein [Planctomycetales bacterium]